MSQKETPAIVAPRFAQTRKPRSQPNKTADLEQVFGNAGYHVEVTRLSSKRYRVTFLDNPWQHTSDDDISDNVDEEMEKDLRKWRHWTIEDDPMVTDSWLLTAP